MRTGLDAWRGRKMLVAEDNLLMAEVVGDILLDCGLEVAGTVGRVDEACKLARELPLDGAVLDIQLHNQMIFPVCTILSNRNIPFFFLTGLFQPSQIPERFADTFAISKPFDHGALMAALRRMFSHLGTGSA